MIFPSGTRLGSYELVERVGLSGLAEVYRARQSILDRDVAVKVLFPDFCREDSTRARFLTEARATGRLNHPSILPMYDAGEFEGTLYVVTSFLDAPTLADELGTRFSVEHTVRMLAAIASALDFGHAAGIVHHDLRPSKIRLPEGQVPVLTDFGLARMLGAPGASGNLGVTALHYGDPKYLAPEQIEEHNPGPAADYYALAVIAYAMLAGRPPFVGDSPTALLTAHLFEPVPLPSRFNPELNTDVDAVLVRGLAKDPAERYSSATLFVQALAEAGQVAVSPVVVAAPAPAAAAARTMPDDELLSAAAALEQTGQGPWPRQDETVAQDGNRLLSVGSRLKHGTFEITGLIGAGGFAEVYRGVQSRVGRYVAIKALRPEYSGDAEIVRRFRDEALIAGGLNHPHILSVIDMDFDQPHGVWFIAMPYVESTLADLVGRPLALPLTARLTSALASALDAVHGNGIIHRDVKPPNVLLRDEQPLLADFGIAHLGNRTYLTRAGETLGTCAYMAPEQWRGEKPAPATDQYALAVVCYEMLAGRTPFVGNVVALYAQHISSLPPALATFRPGLGEEIDRVVGRALSKEPDRRFESCGAFAAALSDAIAEARGEATQRSAPAEFQLEKPSRFWRRVLRWRA